MRFIYLLYISVLLLSSITGLLRFRILDTAGKILSVFVCFTFLTEATAYIIALIYRNNMQFYAVTNVVLMFLLCLYFNYNTAIFRRYRLGLITAVISVVVGVLNATLVQPVLHLNDYFMIYQGVITSCFCLASFFSFYFNENTRMTEQPHFWICVVLISYWSLTLMIWSHYAIMVENKDTHIQLINLFILLTNSLAYLSFAIIFLRFKKMTATKDG